MVDPVLLAQLLPELHADLVSALAYLQCDDFSWHFYMEIWRVDWLRAVWGRSVVGFVENGKLGLEAGWFLGLCWIGWGL